MKIDSKVYKAIEDFKLAEPMGFGRIMAPIMYKADYVDGEWQAGELVPYGPITIEPSAKVLHYAAELFEGMKAYKVEQPAMTLFRPDKNWVRFNQSADRLCMPTISQEQFMEGVNLVSGFSDSFIPTKSAQSLYLRPFMIGTEATLMLGRSSTYSFYIIASPSEAYHAGEMKVLVERQDARAALGGTGAVKVGGNYAAALLSAEATRAKGYDQSMWLDPGERKYIEELSGMNVFALIDGELHTPELSGSILPGVTRDSILQIANSLGIKTSERKMSINELLSDIESGKCTEAFACGTAAVLTSISKIGDSDGKDYILPEDKSVSEQLRTILVGIQEGRQEDTFGWNVSIPDNCYPASK